MTTGYEPSISFQVVGNPTPKGSLTRMPNGAMLPAGTAASRKRFSEWRTDIRDAALVAMGERNPSHSPIRMTCEFALPYPTSSVRKYQMGWLPAVKKPDVDKLLRALMDGLTRVVWHDDSQVIYVTVNKVYAWEGTTGATINIDFLDEEFLRRVGTARNALVAVMAKHGIA
jgi:crossover junction endodeoxyribonuclease RusA